MVIHIPMRRCVAIALCATACTVGPDYTKPTAQIPQSFKEGVEWERARANPQGSLSSDWWLAYRDEQLQRLVEQSLQANQSIAEAEAAYRLARATVAANVAGLYPTLGAGASITRSGTGSGLAVGPTEQSLQPAFTTDLTASWELDLWGKVRREIQSSKETAQATDAELAGERLSIAASVADDYFALRQADIDVDLLKQQRDIDARLLAMMQANYAQGTASSDDVQMAQDTLEAAIAALQSTETSREQDEHAIAVLINVPPANFSIAPQLDYAFITPAIPLSLPSQLLERRYDVVSAERTAAAANANIGVAIAAFYPTLDLSAEAGFGSNMLPQLFSLPNRFWTLGPSLATTLFEGGARTAAVREARATYDEEVANYRQTVLAAFQSVEDTLSSLNHLGQQEQAFAGVYRGNQRLFGSQQVQFTIGVASQQNVLTQQLTLLQAEQSLKDTQAFLTQGSVTLIKDLGGGWQWNQPRNMTVTSANAASGSPVR
jgi:NodT family efflux transporter outer membrane factor (OMF) lipoprotein